jgi:hypothetical protein
MIVDVPQFLLLGMAKSLKRNNGSRGVRKSYLARVRVCEPKRVFALDIRSDKGISLGRILAVQLS